MVKSGQFYGLILIAFCLVKPMRPAHRIVVYCSAQPVILSRLIFLSRIEVIAIRILAWPFRASRQYNSYCVSLGEALEREGIEVVDFSPVRCLLQRWDVIHIHWPERFLNERGRAKAYFSIVVSLLLYQWARLRGAKLVWTAHNLSAHEGWHPKLERFFWGSFTPMVDGWFSLSETAAAAVAMNHPKLMDTPFWVTPHGHYRGVFPNTMSREQARARLKIPDSTFVYLFLGQIRHYKNVPKLIESFNKMADPNSHLLVAGYARDPFLAEKINTLSQASERVDCRIRFLDEDEFQLFFNAADLSVFPYLDILNSGAAILALSFDQPILISNKGSMEELAELVGPDWAIVGRGDVDAAELIKAKNWALESLERRQAYDRAPLQWGDWDHVARQMIDSYESLIAMPKS